jgi:hypothetical protein
MARYKDVQCDQDKFIPASFRKQILPGTFEYTLSYLVDNEFDLSVLDAPCCTDVAFDEAQGQGLLKPVIQNTDKYFQTIGHPHIFNITKLTADFGFNNTTNVAHLYAQGIDGYLPDLDNRGAGVWYSIQYIGAESL